MKITLINPPVSVEDIYGKYSDLASFMYPVGLCALAAYLIKHGYKNVRIIDAPVLNLGMGDVIADIMRDNPDLVGLCATTPNYHVVSKLASEIKSVKKSQKIVVGGPHPSCLPKEVLEKTDIDYCVIGEGERTMLELVRHLEGGQGGLEEIDGLAYRTDTGQIAINKPRSPIEELDSLPFPAIHLLPPPSRYRLYLLHYKRLPYMALLTTRGCPFNCVFCRTPFGRSVRYHSPEYVVDYVEHLLKQFGIKELHFSDDTFSIDEKRVFKMCDLFRKRDFRLVWACSTRVNIKDKNIFYEMKKAGCWLCAVGVESGDPDILHLIKKRISLDEVKATCELVLKAGLRLKTCFILGNPGETLDSIERTIKLSKSLKGHYPVFSLMTPYPGTELWDTAERYGTFDRSNYQKLLISNSDPVFIPHGLTKEALLQKQKEAFRRAYLNFGMLKRQLCSIDTLDDVKKLSKAALAFIKIV